MNINALVYCLPAFKSKFLIEALDVQLQFDFGFATIFNFQVQPLLKYEYLVMRVALIEVVSFNYRNLSFTETTAN